MHRFAAGRPWYPYNTQMGVCLPPFAFLCPSSGDPLEEHCLTLRMCFTVCTSFASARRPNRQTRSDFTVDLFAVCISRVDAKRPNCRTCLESTVGVFASCVSLAQANRPNCRARCNTTVSCLFKKDKFPRIQAQNTLPPASANHCQNERLRL